MSRPIQYDAALFCLYVTLQSLRKKNHKEFGRLSQQIQQDQKENKLLILWDLHNITSSAIRLEKSQYPMQFCLMVTLPLYDKEDHHIPTIPPQNISSKLYSPNKLHSAFRQALFSFSLAKSIQCYTIQHTPENTNIQYSIHSKKVVPAIFLH